MMRVKRSDIKRIVISFYDPCGLEFVGGFDSPFSRELIPELRKRILRLKSVIPGLYGMGVRKPITKIGYLTKNGKLIGCFDKCFNY